MYAFYLRKKTAICLVCGDKATTFAAALREKPGRIYYLIIYNLKTVTGRIKKRFVLFSKKLGGLEKRITFAAAYNIRVLLKELKLTN